MIEALLSLFESTLLAPSSRCFAAALGLLALVVVVLNLLSFGERLALMFIKSLNNRLVLPFVPLFYGVYGKAVTLVICLAVVAKGYGLVLDLGRAGTNALVLAGALRLCLAFMFVYRVN